MTTPRPYLRNLQTGDIRLGILANQAPGVIQRLIAWDIAEYFSVTASSSELGIAKPDPAIFEKALAMAGCAPSEAVMIGDRLDNDMLPAKKIGMQTVWLRSGLSVYHPKELGAEYTDISIESLYKLLEIFE